MNLPGVSHFINITQEKYDQIFSVDTTDPAYLKKCKEYGKWLARVKKINSLLYFNELLDINIEIVSTRPLRLKLADLKKSNFILAFFEGVFSYIYGNDFVFKIKKSNPLIIEGHVKVKKNKKQFIELFWYDV